MTINPEQIRAARAMLKWTQNELADRVKASVNSIKNIEAEATQARPAMLDKIKHAFDTAGIEFLPRSGVREATDLIRVLEGETAWPTIQNDIIQTFKSRGGGVVYYSGADDRRSPPHVIATSKLMRKHNITILHLIEHGNTYIHGKLEEYRWMPKEAMSQDVTAIYDGKVSFSIHKSDYPNHVPSKILLINNRIIYEDYKKKFEFMWKMLPQPTHSTAPDSERY